MILCDLVESRMQLSYIFQKSINNFFEHLYYRKTIQGMIELSKRQGSSSRNSAVIDCENLKYAYFRCVSHVCSHSLNSFVSAVVTKVVSSVLEC